MSKRKSVRLTAVMISPGVYEVRATNPEQTLVGDALRGTDGFFKFTPRYSVGPWPAYILRWLAEKLEELDENYEATLKPQDKPGEKTSND